MDRHLQSELGAGRRVVLVVAEVVLRGVRHLAVRGATAAVEHDRASFAESAQRAPRDVAHKQEGIRRRSNDGMAGAGLEVRSLAGVEASLAFLFVAVPRAGRIRPVPAARRGPLRQEQLGVVAARVRVDVNVALAASHLVQAHRRPGRDDVQPDLEPGRVNPVADRA